MAVGFARLNRWLVAATLVLVSCLLSVLPHGHGIAASTVPFVSRGDVHAPLPDPCLETGAAVHPHDPCAVCCFQRLLSGGEVAICASRAPVFISARTPAPPRAIVGFFSAGLAVPRGPPAV